MNRELAIETLKRVRPQLARRGIAHAAIFGSVARGDAGALSDIDVVVAPAPGVFLNLFDLGGVQSILEEAFVGVNVDVVMEPIRRPRLRHAIERDRARAF
ncbi:MAG: nucleotidyltransferase family protein [Parvularculaceae bacterium]